VPDAGCVVEGWPKLPPPKILPGELDELAGVVLEAGLDGKLKRPLPTGAAVEALLVLG